ncbi:hypothetical protein [Mycobacterium hubeiense]|uniref:hypothetical protein n=1 Tax=Mycobacterium hubeiense TaxID=1867256 RepID=UPI001E3F4302|nr:hypothetical protein [Mycobacterium sp. QGD 101]
MGDIVRYNDAPTRKRLQPALALAVVFWVLLIGSEAALPWSDGPDDHGPHAVMTAVAGEFAVVMDHPHFQQASTTVSPDTFAAAVVPRVATVLVALGLVVAVAAAWLYRGHGIWATVRGPPRGLGPVASGRQLLARFCISRR